MLDEREMHLYAIIFFLPKSLQWVRSSMLVQLVTECPNIGKSALPRSMQHLHCARSAIVVSFETLDNQPTSITQLNFPGPYLSHSFSQPGSPNVWFLLGFSQLTFPELSFFTQLQLAKTLYDMHIHSKPKRILLKQNQTIYN